MCCARNAISSFSASKRDLHTTVVLFTANGRATAQGLARKETSPEETESTSPDSHLKDLRDGLPQTGGAKWLREYVNIGVLTQLNRGIDESGDENDVGAGIG